MRRLVLALIVSGFALPAAAQYAAPSSYNAHTDYTNSESKIVGGKVVYSKAPQPVININTPAPENQKGGSTQVEGTADQAPIKTPDEVGYDVNVKRDPNGNPIEDEKKAAPAATKPALRSDKGMKSDRTLLKH